MTVSDDDWLAPRPPKPPPGPWRPNPSIPERRGGRPPGDPLHKPAPTEVLVDDVLFTKMTCCYCGKPVQRHGLVRRWRHVR